MKPSSVRKSLGAKTTAPGFSAITFFGKAIWELWSAPDGSLDGDFQPLPTFLNLTPGPSPFSGVKITPKSSSAHLIEERRRAVDHRSPASKREILAGLNPDAPASRLRVHPTRGLL
jgi:hypothetical protein